MLYLPSKCALSDSDLRRLIAVFYPSLLTILQKLLQGDVIPCACREVYSLSSEVS